MSFYGANSKIAGGVFLIFDSPPQYKLTKCNTSWTNFPADLPYDSDKIWTITLSRPTGKRKVVIHCNDKEVLNVVMSDTTCSYSDWSTAWSRDVKDLEFLFQYDTASDYYRSGKELICPIVMLNGSFQRTFDGTIHAHYNKCRVTAPANKLILPGVWQSIHNNIISTRLYRT